MKLIQPNSSLDLTVSRGTACPPPIAVPLFYVQSSANPLEIDKRYGSDVVFVEF